MRDDWILDEIRGTHVEMVLLAAEEAGGELPHSGVIEAVSGESSLGSDAAATLRRFGLAADEQSEASETRLTPQGHRVAQSILNSRRNGPERWDAVERGIATSVGNGGGWQLGEVDGFLVTDNETRLAVSNLEKWGLVKARRTGGNELWVVTARDPIHQVPGVQGLLKDHFEGRVSFSDHRTVTSIGDGNTFGGAQFGGQCNTQTVTQTMTADQRADVLNRVDGILQSLDDADQDDGELRAAVEKIRDEALSEESTKSGIKERATEALMVAGASELGHLVLQGLAQLLGAVAT